MNKARAMLDALMGPGRDVKKDERTNDDFTKDVACKHYLVGFCPNQVLGKKLDAIRKDPSASGICPGSVYRTGVVSMDGCTKSHSQGYRTQMNEHPEAEKYKKRYEQELQRFLERIIREADNKVLDEQRKREAVGKMVENEHCWFKICEACGMVYKHLKKKIDTRNQEMWALGDQRMMPGDWACPNCKDIQFAKNPKCRQCGYDRPPEALAALEVPVEDSHPETEVHKAYLVIRKKLGELKEKYKDEEEEKEPEKRPDKEKKSRERRDRSRSRSRRRKDRDGDDEDGPERKKRDRAEKKGDDREEVGEGKKRGEGKKGEREPRRSSSRIRTRGSPKREPQRSDSRIRTRGSPTGRTRRKTSRGDRNDSRSRAPRREGRRSGGHGRRHRRDDLSDYDD